MKRAAARTMASKSALFIALAVSSTSTERVASSRLRIGWIIYCFFLGS